MQNSFKILIVILVFLSFGAEAAAENQVADLEKRCQNLTDQQRQLAMTAGFDIDKLCAKVDGAKSQATDGSDKRRERPDPLESKLDEDKMLIKPRGFQSTEDDEAFLNSLENIKGLTKEDKNKFKNIKDDEELPLEKYGYNLFSGVPTTFAPVTEIPVPVNYVLGVGDTLQVQLLGKIENNLELKVNRDGSVDFPKIGPINLAGLKFDEAKELIKQKVESQMIGVSVHITLGELRSIRVFVSGEAFSPGSYTVHSLSTMTNAIFVSGGVTEIASLRNIQLKRQGKLIATLDLYDLLQKGDNSNDHNIQSGDVIYIPPVKRTVKVKGEVNRPAIYEIKDGENLKDLVQIAGGYSANAYPNSSTVERNNLQGFRTVLDVDLTNNTAIQTEIKTGDMLVVGSILEQVEDVITLTGHFHRTRQFKWFEGMRISNVIKSITEFQDNPELNVALIIRKEMPLRKISIHHFNVADMLANPKGNNDLFLKRLDEIIVLGSESTLNSDQELTFEKVFQYNPDVETELEKTKVEKTVEYQSTTRFSQQRIDVLGPIVEMIKQQTSDGSFAPLVEIKGNVKFPGTYPQASNMTIKDLVLLAGGLEEASYLGNVEITRKDLSDSEKASIKHLNVNLADELKGKNTFVLKPKDKVSIYSTPEYSDNMVIEIEGQIKFPGSYEFRQGETLSQIINRAGGFTSVSHAEAAIFTREDLRLLEEKQLEDLRNRLKSDIVASELEEKAAGKSSSVGQADQLLKALGETEAIGRLVIHLDDILAGKRDDIQLKPGDKLFIPSFRQEISVLGEVQHATSHMFNSEWTLQDYIESSGGITKKADDDHVYVVRADGSVFLPDQGGWLTHQNEMLKPGDVIVVPLDTDRIKSLTLWTQVSQVIYQLSLGAAAITRL